MKRKFILSIVITVALMCVFAISAFAADITVDHINYTTSGTNAYFNANTPTDGTITELVIPEKITYDGVEYTVVGTTRVDGSWPTGDAIIDSVVSVTFPATVTSIDTHTFRLYGGLEYVEFKGAITTFNNAEFYDCKKLEEVKFAFPDSVEYIKGHIFYGCSSLTKITPMNNLKTIGTKSFYGSSIAYISDFSNVTTIEGEAFRGGNISGDICIPNLASIGSHAFRECRNLTSAKLGGTFTGLYNACFYGVHFFLEGYSSWLKRLAWKAGRR